MDERGQMELIEDQGSGENFQGTRAINGVECILFVTVVFGVYIVQCFDK